jgi:hypothetical protein
MAESIKRTGITIVKVITRYSLVERRYKDSLFANRCGCSGPMAE